MNKYFSSIALLIACAFISTTASAQGPFDQTADWGPRSTVKTPGEVEYDAASGTFTLRGNGDDIWNNDDEAFFVYTNLSGSWSLSAKVYWEDPGTSDWSKVGVMMRETGDSATSRNYMAILRGAQFGDRADASWRAATGGGSNSSQMFEDDGVTPAQDFGDGFYVRITRYAELDLVVAEFSYDGSEWFPGHSQNMDFPDEIAWGLVITSHEDTAALVEATISEVKLEPVENVVAVTRSFDASTFLPGQAINVSLGLFNPGANAIDLSLTETAPNGFAISGISNGGSANGNTITWNTSVASGASTLTYTATVPAGYNPSTSGYSAVWTGTDGTVDTQGKSRLFLVDFGVGSEIFSYDFEDATQVDDWTDLAGFFDIDGGLFYEIEDAGGPLVTLVGESLTDAAISVQAQGLVGDADWGIVFRATDLQNFYSWQFVNGSLQLLEYVGGTRTTLYTEPFAEELAVWQDYLVVVKGSVIQLYFNGELHAIVEDDSLASGQVGLFTWVNAGTDTGPTLGGTAFDNLVVSSVTDAANVSNWSLY